MNYKIKSGELTISQIALENAKKIRNSFETKKKRTLTTIDLVSLFRYHFPHITPKENNPLDIILVDFLNNIQHLYTAGANVNSGVPFQSNMLMRTVIETIVKDMRLLALFEINSSEYQDMYNWITTKNEIEYDPELRKWGFAKSRKFLFSNEVLENIRETYAKLSKLVHGSSRLASYNIRPNDAVVENTWDNLYWLTLNTLSVVIYAFRDYMPLNPTYQAYIKSIIDSNFLPSDVFKTNKLPDLTFQNLYDSL